MATHSSLHPPASPGRLWRLALVLLYLGPAVLVAFAASWAGQDNSWQPLAIVASVPLFFLLGRLLPPLTPGKEHASSEPYGFLVYGAGLLIVWCLASAAWGGLAIRPGSPLVKRPTNQEMRNFMRTPPSRMMRVASDNG